MKANIKASSKQKHLNQSAYRSFYCSLRSLFTDSADMPTMNIHQQDISVFLPDNWMCKNARFCEAIAYRLIQK